MSKTTVVLKFGGTSLGTIEYIRNAAKIAHSFTNKHNVVIVVSAMAKFTNSLVEYTNYFYKVNNNKEYDTILAAGEQISAGLFSLALEEIGLKACSLLAWQVPIFSNDIHANAQIKNISTVKINNLLSKQIIPVVSGFQGVTNNANLTTLGRGGSDTTAVALAVALRAEKCFIYTDVNGLYVCDPNIVNNCEHIKAIDFPALIEITNSGAKVLHCRAAELAYKHNIPLYIKSTFSQQEGTLITKGENVLETPKINSIVTSKNEVMFSIGNLKKEENTDLKIINELLEAGINVDLISKQITNFTNEIHFTISKDNLELALKILKKTHLLKNYDNINFNTQVAKISIVGIGLQSHPEIMEKIFKIIIKHDINILLMSLANLKLSFLVNENIFEVLVNVLHKDLSYYINKN